MTAHRAGLAIALAAILVQAPRLVLALLAADRLPVDPAAERALLILAGIGTALVLTGGNLFLAHTVAQVQPWRRTLAAAWLAVLAASGGLALPLIVAGLTARTVPQVLSGHQLEWPWALLAAIAHELTAAGCVLASAAWAARPPASPAGGTVAPPAVAAALPAAPALLPADATTPQRPEPGQPTASPISCRAGCGRGFASRQAEIAHLRHCPQHRAAEPTADLATG